MKDVQISTFLKVKCPKHTWHFHAGKIAKESKLILLIIIQSTWHAHVLNMQKQHKRFKKSLTIHVYHFPSLLLISFSFSLGRGHWNDVNAFFNWVIGDITIHLCLGVGKWACAYIPIAVCNWIDFFLSLQHFYKLTGSS